MRAMRRNLWRAAPLLAICFGLTDGASRFNFPGPSSGVYLSVRGGSSDPRRLLGQPDAPAQDYNMNELVYPNPDSSQQFSQTQGYAFNEDFPAVPGDGTDDPMHETVQDRLDRWKQQQQEHAATAQASARDEQGRVKLMMSVSRGSRATMFVILLFRALFLYEVADKFSGLRRLVLVTPVCLLLVGNLAGVVASLTSPSHSAKKRLKAILNCDKFVEALLILYSFLRLTILPSKYTPREVYVASIFHSVFFIIQSQAFTKLSWDDNGPTPTAVGSVEHAESVMRQSGDQQTMLGPGQSEWNQDLPPSQRRTF